MDKVAGPLAGIRVLELGHIVAGPSAGLILADMGADVIKVEQPQVGDAARNMPNYGSTFFFLNRNKRSLALDLKSRQGIEIFERLIRRSDVVLDNFAPAQLERWGIGFDWAARINQRIIYCSIKGFLPGPDQSRPFLDELAQMSSGLAYMTGPVGQPLRAGASIIDIGAATYGVIGILAALLQRESTGRGQKVNSGLFETAVFWVGQHIARTQITGEVPEPMLARTMGGQMGWGVYQIFHTKDGRQIFVAVTTNHHWDKFCEVLELNEFIGDPDLRTNRQRVAAHARIIPRITEVISKMDFEEISSLLAKGNLPYAPINTPRDLLDDPHLELGSRWLRIHPDGQNVLRMPKLPVSLETDIAEVYLEPPRLGEHTSV
ncbi:MAG: CoA transferase, partial [Actinomycetota bacterium]